MEDDVASSLPSMLSTGGVGLATQSLETLDVDKLTPLTPEVISRQATINVGTIGHVAHGKSTVVKAISGVQTVRFKNELERNITIKLGYANAKVYKCSNPECLRPGCYASHASSKEDTPPCVHCGSPMNLLRHVSFVDCPGHDILMATMLNGAAVMDAALLLIAANENCPQPQTSEHLAAVDIMQLEHIIIVQNKIDLVSRDVAMNQMEDIRAFVRGTKAESSPIIPVSAQLKYNIDVLAEFLVKRIPVPRRNFTRPPRMIVIRSFDVNKPGVDVRSISGGVAGGTIVEGVMKLGQEIEVRPGIILKSDDGKLSCKPIRSRVMSLFAESNELQYAVPGGLIGVQTLIDPTLTRADRLVGHVIGEAGTLPEIYEEITVHYFLLHSLLGVKSDAGSAKVDRLRKEILMVNIGSLSTGGRVSSTDRKSKTAVLKLTSPVCTAIGEKVALSRRVENHWRLIGWGEIKGGVVLQPTYDEAL